MSAILKFDFQKKKTITFTKEPHQREAFTELLIRLALTV